MLMRAAALAAVAGFLACSSFVRIDAQTAGGTGAALLLQPSREPATASIGGRVDGPDGTPVARARVVLRSPKLPHTRATITDARGGYSFERLPAGEYALFVTRTGYTLPLAAGGPGRGVVVHLKDGDAQNAIRIVLQRAGTIPGRLSDEDGTPMAGAEVEALSLRESEAQGVVSTTRTDDRGQFRLTGLPVGQYLVVARDPAFDGVGDETGAVRYAPTYYPGVLSASEAQPISIAEGRESAPLDFRLRIVRPARVSGVIVAPQRRQFLNGAVILVPRDGTLPASLPSEDVQILPNGRFAFRNVPPGTYQIRARAEVGAKEPMLFGTYMVTVGDYHVDGISMPLVPGAIVQGVVEWESSMPGRSSKTRTALRVRAPLADASSLGDSLTGDVSADGRFRIRGVMPGPHFILVEGLPETWTVIAVRWRGRNMLDQPLDITAGERVDDLRVIVSPMAGEVAGTVRDPSGRPSADSLVLTMPPSLLWATRGSPRFRTTRTDQNGRYRVGGLAGGHYRVAAVAGLDELVARRRDWLDRLTAIGVPVGIGPKDVRTHDLTEVQAAALAPSVGR